MDMGTGSGPDDEGFNIMIDYACCEYDEEFCYCDLPEHQASILRDVDSEIELESKRQKDSIYAIRKSQAERDARITESLAPVMHSSSGRSIYAGPLAEAAKRIRLGVLL